MIVLLNSFYNTNMKLKHVIELAFIIALCLSNYLTMMEYYNEYVPEQFTPQKLLQKHNRCIRYFSSNKYDKYIYYSCKEYMQDYIAFQLEKSRYIYMYFAHNTIMLSMFAIFHLVL